MPIAAWQWIGWVTIAIATAWLLWAAWGDRSKGRRRCPRCWYDLQSAGDPPLTCPECGREATELEHLHRPRRRMGHALSAMALALAGYSSIATPRVQGTGWRGAVPTAVLVVAAPWLPRAWDDHEFYRTGRDDPQNPRIQAFGQEMMDERSRVVTGTPTTLAEELLCRWDAEPPFVQSIADRYWCLVVGIADRRWYWWHGIDQNAQLLSLPWELRKHSLRAGALSRDQAHAVRAEKLCRLAWLRPRFDSRDATVRIDVASVALACQTPEMATFSAELLDPETRKVIGSAVLTYDAGAQSVSGAARVGPISWGTEEIVLRYTIFDAQGSIIDEHLVRYEVEFTGTLEGFTSRAPANRDIRWFTRFMPTEVNDEPVENRSPF